MKASSIAACAARSICGLASAEEPNQGAAARTVALAPGSGALGAALAAELQRHGYVVVAQQPVLASLSSPALGAHDVEGVLKVSASSDASGAPERATVSITALDGHTLARVTWSNYWGGWRGPKNAAPQQDRHRNLAQAAEEIADQLVRTPL
jgi:hypothetical protein